MKKFKYYDISQVPKLLILEVLANSIVDSDKLFELEKGFAPIKKSFITVTVENIS